MKQGSLRRGQFPTAKNWTGEIVSLLVAGLLAGAIGAVDGFDGWNSASIGLAVFVLWIVCYYFFFQLLDNYTP